MAFPSSLSGAFVVKDISVEQAIPRLESCLDHANAVALRRHGNVLEFKGGVFRPVWNFNVLVPITNGIIEVMPARGGVTVHYRVTFREMLFVVTGLVGFVGLGLMRESHIPMGFRLASLSFMWLWVCGGSFVLTRWRFRSLLVRSLSRAAA